MNATVAKLLQRPMRVLLTGVLAALPLAATVLIVAWTARLVMDWIGPRSVVGGAFAAIGVHLSDSPMLGYGLGLLIVLAVIFALGLLVEAELEQGLTKLVDALIGRIPVVRSVYDVIRRFVEVLAPREGNAEGLQSMSAVWCHFGGPGGAVALALLSTPEPVLLGSVRYLAVLIPTAPVPVGGGLIYVPEDWVTPADVGVEAVTSIYVSMGVTSAQHLSKKA